MGRSKSGTRDTDYKYDVCVRDSGWSGWHGEPLHLHATLNQWQIDYQRAMGREVHDVHKCSEKVSHGNYLLNS